MAHLPKLRIVVLAGHDDAVTRETVAYVCATSGIEPVAILLDTARPGWKARIRNLQRNVRRSGTGYIWRRVLAALADATDRLVDRAGAPPSEVDRLLRRAFPERPSSLDELAARLGCPVIRVNNLNGPDAVRSLQGLQADLGLVLGTRILKPPTFSAPRLGCLNLHKGRAPEYRGLPPGFWELYDGVDSAGITVHFVDSGLDTGDVVLTSSVPIERGETPESIRAKLDEEGMRVLAEAVRDLAHGTAVRKRQPRAPGKPRTKPTPAEVAELARRLPHWSPPDPKRTLAKNLFFLAVWYSGVYTLTRWVNRQRGRAAVVLYHRVNDRSRDAMTVDTATFAGHLAALSRYRRPVSTAELVDAVRERRAAAPGSVAIHFDDCYRDVLTCGAPLLRAAGWLAAAYVSSGYVGSDRVFAHDSGSPWTHPNFTRADLVEWTAAGFEIGAHTVNHVDLGGCPADEARREIAGCGAALERITGRPVDTFSYPFGTRSNINPQAAACVRDAGYRALFSAHGGFVTPETDPYDIPRIAANYSVKPLFLLVELEGLAPHQLFPALRPAPVLPVPPEPEPVGETAR